MTKLLHKAARSRALLIANLSTRRFATAKGKHAVPPASRVSPKFYESKSPRIDIKPPPNPPGPLHEVNWGKTLRWGAFFAASCYGTYWAYEKAVAPSLKDVKQAAPPSTPSVAVPAGSSIVDLRPGAAAATASATSAAPAPVGSALSPVIAPASAEYGTNSSMATAVAETAPSSSANSSGRKQSWGEWAAYDPKRTWLQWATFQVPTAPGSQSSAAPAEGDR